MCNPSAVVPTEGARKASIRPGPDRRKAWQMPKRGTGHRSGKSRGVGVAEVLAAHGHAVPKPKRRRFRAALLAGGVVALVAAAVNMSGPSAPPTGPGSAGVRGDDPVTVTETSSPSSPPAPPPAPAAPAADAPGPGASSGGGLAVRNAVPSSSAPATADRSTRSPSPVPARRPSPIDPAPPAAAPPPPPAPVPPEEESDGFLDGLGDLLP